MLILSDHLTKYFINRMKQYFNLFDFAKSKLLQNGSFSRFVAMTMIPESLSFAILAGFPPLVGLYAAFIMGLVTAIFGGRPGMVSGGAGATVIVLIALMKSNGLEYVFCSCCFGRVIQILIGLFKLASSFVVPQPVMFGFVWFSDYYFYVAAGAVQTIVNGESVYQVAQCILCSV
jgi:SulP family sulfate permease